MVVQLKRNNTRTQDKPVKVWTEEEIAKQCESIVKASGNNRGKMQDVTIGAMHHYREHGNVNIYKPVYLASLSFGRNLSQAWAFYVDAYGGARFNPNGLRGQALTTAEFEKVWGTRRDKDNKLVKPDIERAAGVKFWDAKRPEGFNQQTAEDMRERGATDEEIAEAERIAGSVNVPDTLKRFAKRIGDALADGKALGADGKPLTKATIVKMVSEFLEQNLKDQEVKAGRDETPDTQPTTEIEVKDKREAKAA